MKVEAFIIAWNVEDTIAFTIDHYKQVCDKITIYDNFSTDRTKEIAESMGAKVVTFGVEGILNDQHYLDVKNHCWKGSKADWVIVVDDDEILWGPFLKTQLMDGLNNGHTIIKPQGFGIYSNQMPKKRWTEILTGVPDDNYSKLCCFNPRSISEINYVFGCHVARPVGRIDYFDDPYLFLLHYRAVGGVQRLINRQNLYKPRKKKSAINEKWGLGANYDEPDGVKIKWFNDNLAKSKSIW